MTARERFWAAVCGERVDRIPAVCRLEPWYYAQKAAGTMPAEVADKTLEEMQEALGFGVSARKGAVFEKRLRGPVSFEQAAKGDLLIGQWRTPKGDLQKVQRLTEEDRVNGLMPTILEHPIKSLDDYVAYEAVIQHTEFVARYEQFEAYDRQLGEAGVPLTTIGQIPMHDLLINWVGYEKGYMDLYDRPDVFLAAVDTANQVYRRMWQIVAASPCRLVMHGANFDTAMTSPPVFREHFLGYLKDFNGLMHETDKKTVMHADGDMIGLLELSVEAGFDVADCFACAPMVRCTFEQARRVWGDRITIWGGVPSNMLESAVSLERLAEHLQQLYAAAAPGRGFILAISDQALPSASWGHIRLLADWARQHGEYPLKGNAG